MLNGELAGGSPSVKKEPRILILGLGGAGCCTLARMAPGAPSGMEFAIADCDTMTLERCGGIENRLALGESLTDGMSAGGDPDTGRRCAENDVARLETLLSGVDLLIMIVGFGGGFGTGAAPVAARTARHLGAAVLVFSILPFPFEGPVARNKAYQALRRLRTYTDAVVQLPNELIQPDGNELFADSLERSGQMLGDGVIGLWRMLCGGGVCPVDFSVLHTLINYCDAFCRFACATAYGEDRADEVVRLLREHPLLRGSGILEKAPGMIIGVTGGEDMRLAEVQRIVEAIAPGDEACWLRTGIATDRACNGRISVFILAAESWKEPLIDDGRGGIRRSNSIVQGELAGVLAPRSRRFGGAERTIWKGEDLDTPAYIRRKIKIPR